MNVIILKEKLDALANAIGIKAKKRVPQTIEELIETVEGIETAKLQPSKSVEPKETAQTVTPDQGYDGMEVVEVEAAPLQSVSVTQRFSGTGHYETGNGYYGMKSLAVTVPSMTLPTSTSSSSSGTFKINIFPSTSNQYLIIPTGYNDSTAYYWVRPMDAMTLPTGTSSSASGTTKATIGRSTFDKYINIPTGYNSSAANYKISAVADGSATTPATTITANPLITLTLGGLVTATTSASKSVTPTVSAGYVSSGTAGTVSVSGSTTLQLDTQSGTTITPTESEQTAVARGKYTTGDVKVAAIPSQYIIPAGNKEITANGTNIDVTNYATVSVAVPASVGGIYQDENGYLVLSETGGGGSQYAWLGNGAEKVGTVISRTINLQNDTGYDSWTASTTATTLIEADTDPYYTATNLDFSSYDYCLVMNGYIEPVYINGTPMTYTTKRVIQRWVYYTYGHPNSSSTSYWQNDTADSQGSASSAATLYVQYFYNSSGEIVARSATQCGPLYMSSSPSVSSSVANGTITFKFPAFNAKCDSSRFSTDRKAQVDSASTNYVVTVDLYRVPHGNGLMSYWIAQTCAELNA